MEGRTGISTVFAVGARAPQRRARSSAWVAIVVLALIAVACESGSGDDAGAGGSGDESGATPTPPLETPTPTSTATAPPPGSTLEAVITRGTLLCGVGERRGFSDDTLGDNEFDETARTGFDVDFCRAIAAAVLGDAKAVKYVEVSSSDRFNKLGGGEIDVLIRTTTWTSGRDTRFDFGPTTYYDGQQIMGRKPAFAADSTVVNLDAKSVCVGRNTTAETTIVELAEKLGAAITLVRADGSQEAVTAFAEGACDAVVADSTTLGPAKDERDAGNDWVIFPPKVLSREPLGPVYRADDSEWGGIVDWTVYALIIADELGVTSENVDPLQEDPTSSEMKRLLTEANFSDPDLGDEAKLSVDADAFYRAIKQVGNYNEIFVRNLGPIGYERANTLNASFEAFGLIYAPPLK